MSVVEIKNPRQPAVWDCSLVSYEDVKLRDFLDGTNRGVDFTGTPELDGHRMAVLEHMPIRSSTQGRDSYREVRDDYLSHLESEAVPYLDDEYAFFRTVALARHEAHRMGTLAKQVQRLLRGPARDNIDMSVFCAQRQNDTMPAAERLSGSARYFWIASTAISHTLDVMQVV